VCNEVAKYRAVLADRSLERYRVSNELGLEYLIELQPRLVGELLRAWLTTEL